MTRYLTMPCGAGAATLLAAVALLCTTPPAVAQEPGARQPAPPVAFFASGALSLRQTPLKTFFGDVASAFVRADVPVRQPLHLWLGGGLAHVKAACDSIALNCSSADKRVLLGAAYEPGRTLGGAYVGGGLGVSFFRGKQTLAHTFFIGLAIPATPYLAPTFELRSEKYGDLNEVLMVSVGLQVAVPR